MYFVRTYKSGGADHDPRQKTWAEFHCSICGNDHNIDVTSTYKTFDFQRERVCPHCKQLNSEDRKKNIQAEIDKLTEDKRKIDIKIKQLIKELESDTIEIEFNRNLYR